MPRAGYETVSLLGSSPAGYAPPLHRTATPQLQGATMTARWITADVFDGLATLEDGSVDLVVTSPPFLALRSYLPASHPDKSKEIGSEATPAEFIDVMLRVTAELRRVLAPHGSICVELGDTYSGSGEGGGDLTGSSIYPPGRRTSTGTGRNAKTGGWPLAKSRTLIPQLYEIALAYGINPLTGNPSPAGQWRIRNVVTWARPNPPVGALGDKWRPATSDLIVACTSGKRYWDDLATRKPHRPESGLFTGGKQIGRRGDNGTDGDPGYRPDYEDRPLNPSGAPLLDYWEIPLLEGEEPKQYGPQSKSVGDPKIGEQDRSMPELLNHGGHMGTSEHGAPLLDYWEIPPGGYKGSHYAVFPEELVVPCVKAMCPEKVCRVCGEPSRRITESDRIRLHDGAINPPRVPPTRVDAGGSTAIGMRHGMGVISTTVGWTDCGHDDYRPGLILDPFAGSGTTLSVATGHGHDAIGIDLDPRNADLARDRIGPFLFEEVGSDR